MSKAPRPAIAAVLILNTCFWGWFWLDIVSRLEPYEHKPLRFEEVLPEYVFFDRALRFPQELTAPPLRVMRTIHWPSDRLSVWASWSVVRTFRLVEITPDRIETIAGISVAGYQLLLTMLLSYVQWLIVAIAATSAWSRFKPGSRL